MAIRNKSADLLPKDAAEVHAQPPAVAMTAVEVKAGDILIKYILELGHWGLGIVGIGFAFAITGIATRFGSPADMAAPEFIACLVFAAVVCMIGGVIHLAELKFRWIDPTQTVPVKGQTVPVKGQVGQGPGMADIHGTAHNGGQISTPAPVLPSVAAAVSPPPLNAALRSARIWALSTLERAFFTFVSSFISAISLSAAFNTNTADVALFAAASAALAVVTAAIRSLTPPAATSGATRDAKILDVVTRVGLTLVQTFIAAFVTNTAGATHFSDWRAGAVAGLAAAVTALKSTGVVKLAGANNLPGLLKFLGGTGATPASLVRVKSS
jgi:hypothetical protein